jgi:putative ABC transport system ATP-binding protein
VTADLVIRLRDIHKSYGIGNARTEVLRGVSFDVGRGEIVALVGQSGSGKSTLLNIIGGLDTAESGTVEVLDHDYAKSSERTLAALRNRELGFVFQSFNLLDHLSCLGNVVLPAAFAANETIDVDARGREVLDRVGLGEFIDRKPGELSGGQKQRVAIARAMFHQPSLLLCDEPTGNLDTETGRQVIEFFSELNREDGVTLLIVTHEERVSTAATRVVRIEDGQIIEGGALIEPEPATATVPDAKAKPEKKKAASGGGE